MKNNIKYIVVLLLIISCKKETVIIENNKKKICRKEFNKEQVFEKLNYYVKYKHICDDKSNSYHINKYIKIHKYFSDINFDFYNYEDNTRLIYGKENDIWLAISSNGFLGFDLEGDKKNRFLGIYILNKKLIPTCFINQNFSVSVFVDDNKNKKLIEYLVKLNNFKFPKFDEVKYSDIINLNKEIQLKNYKIIKEFNYENLKIFYEKEPLWTVLR